MKKFYCRPGGLYALMVCLVFASCSKEEDPIPETALEITVVNELGNTVSEAKVTVYSSEEAWVHENPAELVASGTTDANGKVTLKGVEAKKYFFNITHGSSTFRTNWEGASTTEAALEANKINTVNVVIKESIFGYLVGAGKNWILDKVYFGSEDYTDQMDDCTMDDAIAFIKDFVYVYDEGATKCNSTDPQESKGTYTLNGNNLTTIDEHGEGSSIIIYAITNDKLEMGGGDLHPDVRMQYRAVNK